MFKFISLFSGIGGLDLGLERAGMECVAQVEIEEFQRSVLAKHWPDVPKFRDIKEYHPDRQVDCVAGGFPCQDLSQAKAGRAGLAGERSGLFFEAMRVVDEAKPNWVILENVPGLLSSNGGRDFARVLEELAKRGFDVEWSIVSACSMGAPHRRKRLFVVAHSDGSAEGRQRRRFRFPEDSDTKRNVHPFKTEPEPHRVVDGIPHRVDRNSGLGNAVVPQVAERIGRIVMASAIA